MLAALDVWTEEELEKLHAFAERPVLNRKRLETGTIRASEAFAEAPA